MNDLVTLFNKLEPLHPDLIPYLDDAGQLGKMIHHPLIIEVIIAPEMFALINARFIMKRKMIAECRFEKNWHKFVWLHERPYRLEAFLEIAAACDKLIYTELLRGIWIDSENIFQHLKVWKNLWSKDLDSSVLMENEERNALEALPEQIEIYRGIKFKSQKSGLAWTLDRQKAEWFATRMRHTKGTPILLKAKVPKSKVLAHFKSRNEAEIITANARIIQQVIL